jgi:peptidoglycan/LPS O-acetylase OafA/YrhL
VPRREGHRRDIDGLRAVAVLAVVAYHAGLPCSGFVGVDVFFVISGFLITGLLLDEPHIDLWNFYARRARRLLPAMLIVAVATCAAGVTLLSATEALRLTDSAVAGMLMMANFHFAANSGGYFDGNANLMPLLHLWSLAVEEQFYILWPLLLAFTPRRWLSQAVVALIVLSFVAAELVTQEAAFYGMPLRLWELAAGGILAIAGTQGRAFHANLGAILLLVSMAVPYPTFPGIGAIPAVAGAVLVLFGNGAGVAGRIFSMRPMVYIGLISYPLYLWHWPLLAINRATYVGESPVAMRTALCALAIALAAATYRWIERPFRQTRRDFPPRRVVGVGAAAIAALVVSVHVIAVPARSAREFERYAESLAHDVPANFGRCMLVEWKPEEGLPEGCVSGVGPLTVVWGDSHAMAWQPMAEAQGGAVQTLTLSSCAPVIGFDSAEEDIRAERCREFNRLVLDRIQRGGVDRLVLATRWSSLVEDLNLPHETVRSMRVPTAKQRGRRGASAWAGFPATLAAVTPHVREVVIMGPVPQLYGDIGRCVLLQKDCSLSRSDFEAWGAGARAEIERIAAAFPNVCTVDPSPFFCSGDRCLLQRDGIYLYFDDDHISASAARAFASTVDCPGIVNTPGI